MKVAIITHSLRYNYGGILQNYALQQVLKRMGHEPITLKIFRVFPQKPVLYVKYLAKALLGMKRLWPMSKRRMDAICVNTDKFINAHIEMSPLMNFIDRNWVICQNYDAFVVGSDQILHPGSYTRIEDIFLSFVENDKKIMYAASFGGEKWMYSQTQEKECAKYIRKFKAVSIRENTGVTFMKDKFGVNANLVLDPTLLLKAEDYRKLIQSNSTENSIVTYILDPTIEKNTLISTCSKILGKNAVQAGNDQMDNPCAKIKDRVAPSVETWLEKIANADFIITDSYHGTIFSIIFKKNFITIGNHKRGMDRFSTILGMIGLSDRLVLDPKKDCDRLFLTLIDYGKVYSLLEKHQEESTALLRKSFC